MRKAAELDPKLKDLEVKRRYVHYLRITNATSEQLEVFVNYYTPTVSGSFRWYPADPSAGTPVKVQIEPGKTVYLFQQQYADLKIKGSKFRIWANGASKTYTNYKDRDLEVSSADGYVAADYGVFDYTFR
jgi:hypothetical protein